MSVEPEDIIYHYFIVVKFKMKICAIICEFNPFHNGHKYILEKARKLSGCDKLLCIMSGSFTQRGDIAVLGKYTRARHAVLGGADCVIELPVSFSVAPAEIFAKGAIKILSCIPDVKYLAFGCEDGDKTQYLQAAEILLNESEDFKAELNKNLADKFSYIKSYCAAFKSVGGKGELLEKPNNILGLEYAKAVLKADSDIEILPIKRVGADFNDGKLQENYSSASAIRRNLTSPLIKTNVPDFVYADLTGAASDEKFKWQARYDLVKADTEDLKGIFGCSEGLENRLIGVAKNFDYDGILKECTSKRYSQSRIKRIMCANLLGLYGGDCKSFLNSSLYIKPLAVKKEGADETLSALAKSAFPVITRGRDFERLSPEAKKCFELDEKAYSLYKMLSGLNSDDNLIFI